MIEKFALFFWFSPYPLMLLLVSLIPALILGVLITELRFVLEKITSKKGRAIAPIIISLALAVLIIASDRLLGAVTDSSAATYLLLLVLEFFIIIALFDRVEEKIPFQRKWLALAITSAIVFLFQAILLFFSIAVPPRFHDVFLSYIIIFIISTILISTATFGIFLFLKKSEDGTYLPQLSKLGLIIVGFGTLFFTTFLFIGGLTVYFFTFLKEFKRPIFPIVVSLTGAMILSIAGFWLTGTQNTSWLSTTEGVFLLLTSISLVVVALTFTIAGIFEKKQMFPILVYGSILTGIITELVIVFNTPLISKDLFSFSSLITWFVSACVAFGIIFCIISIHEKQKPFQELQRSHKVLLSLVIILGILAMFTVGLLLLFPIDVNPVPGKTWNRAVSDPPFGERQDYSLVEWNDSLWIIGGNVGGNYQGSNETWFSRNGVTWTVAALHAAFEARYDHSSVVFDNKIWVIGGVSTGIRKNDVWYSTDGKKWEQATRSAEFPPSDPTRAVVFDNKIWVFTNSGSWNSDDGVNWIPVNSSFVIPWNGGNPAVMKGRIYYIADGMFDLFWNSQDGIIWYNGTTPPFSTEKYSANSNANFVVVNDTIWIFRSFTDHESRKDSADIWQSHDGNIWILVTDSPAYTKNIENIIDFKPIIHNNKIWAFITLRYHDFFSSKYSQKFEIWYSDL